MAYQIHKNVMPDPKARRAFDALASQVFGLSFEDWYAAGYWTASNLPYTLFDGDTALANVSVNRLTVLLQGRRRPLHPAGHRHDPPRPPGPGPGPQADGGGAPGLVRPVRRHVPVCQ